MTLRILVITDVILLVLALLLYAVNLRYDGNALLGTHVNPDDIVGRRLEDILPNQSFIPDKIEIFPQEDLIGLTYEPSRFFLHKYPLVTISTEGDLSTEREKIANCVVW